MTTNPLHGELIDLAFAVCDGSATDDQIELIEEMVSADPAARLLYLQCLELHFEMDRRASAVPAEGEERRRRQLSGEAVGSSSPSFAAFPAITYFPTHSLSPSSFVGSWIFSYMIATVILAVMLLGAWAYKITHYQQIADSSRGRTSPGKSAPERPELVFVGRITGMADCLWADPQTEAYAGASVPLDRKYALASGLMEITYATGAKVILQGPCTYEVESDRGGYLSLGKLTARIEERREKREERAKPQAANLKSPVPRPPSPAPLFSVRTPTAVVTDLGTEFGVEVEQDGNTISHVFRGLVKVQVVGDDDRQETVLRENESARVEKRAGKPSITRRVPADDSRFVLEMPPPKSVRDSAAYAELVLSFRPVVYYRMERPEKGTGPISAKHPEGRSGQLDLSPSSVVFDSAGGGHHGKLRLGNEFGSPYVPGRFGSALWLRGPVVCDRVVVPDYPKTTNDRLTVSAWVMATGRPGWAAIASNWAQSGEGRDDLGQFHLGLKRLDGDLCAYVTQRDGQQIQFREGVSQQFPLFVWQHVALVADGTTLHLFRNGNEVASTPCAGILPQLPTAGLGVGCKLTNETGTDAALDTPGYNFWQGRIDELAIFNRALSAETIQALFFGKQLPEKNEATTKDTINTKGGHPMNGP